MGKNPQPPSAVTTYYILGKEEDYRDRKIIEAKGTIQMLLDSKDKALREISTTCPFDETDRYILLKSLIEKADQLIEEQQSLVHKLLCPTAKQK